MAAEHVAQVHPSQRHAQAAAQLPGVGDGEREHLASGGRVHDPAPRAGRTAASPRARHVCGAGIQDSAAHRVPASGE